MCAYSKPRSLRWAQYDAVDAERVQEEEGRVVPDGLQDRVEVVLELAGQECDEILPGREVVSQVLEYVGVRFDVDAPQDRLAALQLELARPHGSDPRGAVLHGAVMVGLVCAGAGEAVDDPQPRPAGEDLVAQRTQVLLQDVELVARGRLDLIEELERLVGDGHGTAL